MGELPGEEELLQRIARIDAEIDELIEDGISASSSRVRALRAKKAVLQNPNTVTSSRKRVPARDHTSLKRQKISGPARIKPVQPVRDLLAHKAKIPQKSKAAARLHRRAIENATEVVNALGSRGIPRTIAEADVMFDEIQSEIAYRVDGGQDYPKKLRFKHGNQRRAVREVRQALKWRRRSAPVEPAELSEILYAWALREVERRRNMPAATVGVVGMIQVRSGGAPSLGKRS